MTKSALFTVPKNEPCPQCGAGLVIRSGNTALFLAVPITRNVIMFAR